MTKKFKRKRTVKISNANEDEEIHYPSGFSRRYVRWSNNFENSLAVYYKTNAVSSMQLP